MNPSEPIPFEVEDVFRLTGTNPVVLARRLEERDFRLGEDPRLGGCPVLRWGSQPRALRPDGSPRLDLYAFQLRDREDLERFHPGQRVVLAP